jgi:hypothetical protein
MGVPGFRFGARGVYLGPERRQSQLHRVQG